MGGFIIFSLSEYADLSALPTNQQAIAVHEQSAVFRQYKSNKSNVAEIETFIQAIKMLLASCPRFNKVSIYTDCQSLCQLQTRQEKLERMNFKTKSGKELSHAQLYRRVFVLTDTCTVEFKKIKGHRPQSARNLVEDRLFAHLDTLVRKHLRAECKK